MTKTAKRGVWPVLATALLGGSPASADSVQSPGVVGVTNSDGTLTISPTTGAVVASLNLANANTWTGSQTFGTATTVTLPDGSTATSSGFSALGIGAAPVPSAASIYSQRTAFTFAGAQYDVDLLDTFSSAATSAIGIQVQNTASGATLTNYRGGLVNDIALTNSATVATDEGLLVNTISHGSTTATAVHINGVTTASSGNNFGLQIGNVSGSSGGNFAIQTNTGTVQFGGATKVATTFQVGSTGSPTLSTGEQGMAKISASGTAPSAGFAKFEWVAGTTGGTCKLISYAGTSTTPSTIVDNVGSGC